MILGLVVDGDRGVADFSDDAKAKRFDVRAKGADLCPADVAVFDLADAHLRDVHQLGKRILRFTVSLANLRKSVGAHFAQHLSLEVSNARRLGPALCLLLLHVPLSAGR